MAKKALLTDSQKKIIFFFPRLFFKFLPAEKWLCRTIEQRKALKLYKQFIPPATAYNKDTWRKANRAGINFRFNLSEQVDWYNYFALPQQGFENFLGSIPEDAIVLDVGANIGTTALRFAKKCSKGMIYAFEPAKENYKRLRENISLNELTNIVAVNKGCGNNHTEKLLVHAHDHNSGMNRIAVSDDEEGEIINIIRLDDFVKEKGVKKIHAIKADTEGFELQVLMGAAEILEKDKPVLLLELEDEQLKKMGSSAAELIHFLNQKGYSDIRNAETLEKINPGEDLTALHLDIICKVKN